MNYLGDDPSQIISDNVTRQDDYRGYSKDENTRKEVLVMIKRTVRVLTTNRKPQPPSTLLHDWWYLRNSTARAQGEFWYHVLLGR